ncbi:MAG: hypothetical protein ACP5XB_08715 [Isosphaeraceae bacterium]
MRGSKWQRVTRAITVLTAFVLTLAVYGPRSAESAAKLSGPRRVREATARPLLLVHDGHAEADIVLLSDDVLVRNAALWLTRFLAASTGARLTVGGPELLEQARVHLVAAVGDDHRLKALNARNNIRLDPGVGMQGFVLELAQRPDGPGILLCWSPQAIGCRYGLIEVLRSVRVEGKNARLGIQRVVDWPRFERRICYVNFAEHLQNAFNPNVLFDVPDNRWTLDDWDRFIDMISAFRYNTFEFWLVPSLFSPEALHGGAIQRQFAETINHVIAYGKKRGVAVHPTQAVNTVGRDWHYLCPHDPKEHAEIVALWDHWSRAIRGNESIGFFPGDPGGCIRNGCTPETYVDLCLELSRVVRRNNPGVMIEVGTWGEPMGGWGVPLWSGTPQRAARAMRYFLEKLPEFPAGTFTSINQGFSPDALPGTHGGDGRPYAREAAKRVKVLTWDYSVSEGEGTVSPRCRVRRMFERRREEAALGCYSGGICYTMAPRLQCLSLFCSAESWWDPTREPDAVLRDFGRFVFGEPLQEIGPLLEEFEVIPDWGYYPPFPYSPTRLEAAMTRLIKLLDKAEATAETRLPLAPTLVEHRRDLRFFADLFRRLAGVAITARGVTADARAVGLIPQERSELVSLDEMEEWLAEASPDAIRRKLEELSARLRGLDVQRLSDEYWKKVYGIYDHIPHPVDPRAQGATSTLFTRFHASLALASPASPLDDALRRAGGPSLRIHLGRPTSPHGWTLSGWTVQGIDHGETWQASFDQPGRIIRDNFHDLGYRWLTVRLTEGPKGAGKTIALGGRVIGRFERTGPPVTVKKEWWVTRSYPIPPGLLPASGRLEIRFTEPGIAISEVALSVQPPAETGR